MQKIYKFRSNGCIMKRKVLSLQISQCVLYAKNVSLIKVLSYDILMAKLFIIPVKRNQLEFTIEII